MNNPSNLLLQRRREFAHHLVLVILCVAICVLAFLSETAHAVAYLPAESDCLAHLHSAREMFASH